jgi:L-iditol 2-dehydrogenase
MLALTYDVHPVRWTLCKAAGWFTPAAFWSVLSGLRLRSVATPRLPSPRWVRLRPILGGICGTDLVTLFQRHHPASILQVFSSFPAMLGHENVSIIEEIGAEVSGWRVGDRVVVEPTLACSAREIDPPCARCAEGRFTLCEHFRTGPLPIGSMIGWNNFTGGSWSESFVAHASQLYRVPEGITDDEAVLTDPIAGSLHAVLRCRPTDDQTVLIVGGGLLGLGVAAALRALTSNCRVVCVVRHARQGEWMRRFGADEAILVGRRDSQGDRYGRVAQRVGGHAIPSKFGHHALVGGFDVVYDCVGSGQSLTDSMKYARAGGTVVEVGTTQISLVDTAPLWLDELTVLGANGRAFETYNGRRLHTYEIVFDLICQKRLDLKGLVTHRFSIHQFRDALRALAHRGESGAIKVVFTPAATRES